MAIWRSGSEAGIIGVGRILDHPGERVPNSDDRDFTTDPTNEQERSTRVSVCGADNDVPAEGRRRLHCLAGPTIRSSPVRWELSSRSATPNGRHSGCRSSNSPIHQHWRSPRSRRRSHGRSVAKTCRRSQAGTPDISIRLATHPHRSGGITTIAGPAPGMDEPPPRHVEGQFPTERQLSPPYRRAH